jgi:hypothetical protein
MKIEFLESSPVADKFKPYPASEKLPDWYKKTEKHIGGKRFFDPKVSGISHTIKACMPVTDTLTSGYIIPLQADLIVTRVDIGDGKTEPYFAWADGLGISNQTMQQAQNHPAGKGLTYYPKFNNPWGVKTSSGYSCLFVSPLNNPNGFFTILPGIVDTDSYVMPVNFPFVLDDPEFSGVIPAGTPVAQVIPFKRDSWHSVIRNDHNGEIQRAGRNLKAKIFNAYKQVFWSRKEFK